MKERFKMIRNALKLSQDEFGEKLGLTRGAIANVELGRTEAKPLFISLVCSTFNVNETWLRTGEGEMFNAMSRDEQIAYRLGAMLAGQGDTIQKRLIAALSDLDESEWSAVEAFARKLVEQSRDAPPNTEGG